LAGVPRKKYGFILVSSEVSGRADRASKGRESIGFSISVRIITVANSEATNRDGSLAGCSAVYFSCGLLSFSFQKEGKRGKPV